MLKDPNENDVLVGKDNGYVVALLAIMSAFSFPVIPICEGGPI